jgi:type I restriction enzyme R subunit
MVLRPYQIHAIKKIKEQVSKSEGGFIWHATGSGKTITSFVATKLLAQTATSVKRTIMIVDRKDLDSQTKNEFSKFASEYSTGQTSGDVTDNTLIVGIGNRDELVKNLISDKNNNTIIITTIQKLSHAIRDMQESDSEKKQKQFEKLKGEHIVFIVDECHRAVSDKETRKIKDIFPCSTWFGFTGTPIFKENQKEEVGTYARTTYDQYGELLHAYTTKNAMEDKSVLEFQNEYVSLLSEEDEESIYFSLVKDESKLNSMTVMQKEALLESSFFENDEYIEAMLKRIFRHQSVLGKYKVINGIPTISAILTTHSIAQAKRIYKKLQELKQARELITGNPLDPRRRLNDLDFPRVAVTYSHNENENTDGVNSANEELKEIISEYNAVFGTSYELSDIDRYNININNRLARKDAQYKKDGNWLDLVIVVDRLLTGFDAPTILTLYVDRELRFHKLLQAFSRTNRLYQGKEKGMIVTLRKPETMRENVRMAIKLFSNEERDWEKLVPKEYGEVKSEFKKAYEAFKKAQSQLSDDPNDLKKRLTVIKTFGAVAKTAEAIKSYEEFGSCSKLVDRYKKT